MSTLMARARGALTSKVDEPSTRYQDGLLCLPIVQKQSCKTVSLLANLGKILLTDEWIIAFGFLEKTT
jgi:hypothetical protein